MSNSRQTKLFELFASDYGISSNTKTVETRKTRTSSTYSQDINIDYQDQLVQYFYNELLKYVIEEHSFIPQDKSDDSDEEPTYNTESKSNSEEPKSNNLDDIKSNKNMTYNESYSKLRSRILANQSFDKRKSQTYYSQISHSKTQNEDMHDQKNDEKHKVTKIRYNISQADNKSSIKRKDTLSYIKELKYSMGNSSNNLMGLAIGGEFDELNLKGDTIEDLSQQYPSALEHNQHWLENENCEKQRMIIKFTTGAVYSGDVLRHQFHGKGMYKWPEGVIYEGEFEHGKVTGFGKLTFRDLSYYQGTLINCVLHGTGTFCPSDCNIAYSGNWSNGFPHGKGQLRYHETDWYEGQWFEGFRHGQGTRLYANKALYVGSWNNGNLSGKGSMVFPNRDFYHGEWSNGKPNGYGQYIWKASLTDGTTYSMVTSYTGHFVNGVRDGYGVQTFGMEGSKLASLFDDNMKSGPGILICGNGTTIEKKPLFLLDNPLAKKAFVPVVDNTSSNNMKRASCAGQKANPEKVTSNRSKIAAAIPSAEAKTIPLSIPLHANSKDISLSYHVTRFLNYCNQQNTTEPTKQESANYKTRAKSSKIMNNLITHDVLDLTLAHEDESRLLQRAISNHYVYLRCVYQKYATLNPLHVCNPDLRNPVMSRFKMWQFLRDIKIYKFHMSLIDVDREMLEVPNINLDSEHDPFEQFYFWQFMHCILILSFAMFTFSQKQEEAIQNMSNTKLSSNPKKYSYQAIFRTLIQTIIKPCEGSFEGRALFVCKNLLPIKRVHELYKTVGEPHSARILLNRICHKQCETPINCIDGYKKVYDLKGTEKHFVLGDVNILYLEAGNNYSWSMEEAPKLNKYANDPFYTDLRVFRILGPEIVVKCITAICPTIMENEAIVFIDYQITFLEFYEILINLAEQLSTIKKKEETKEHELRKTEEIRISQLIGLASSSFANLLTLDLDPATISKKKNKKSKTVL